jgi:ribose 5-phosphate isomerase A
MVIFCQHGLSSSQGSNPEDKMRWDDSILGRMKWTKPIDNLEAKQQIADKLASLVHDGDVIGFGSGSTSFLAIQAIAASAKARGLSFKAIPTSAEIEFTCVGLGIETVTLIDARPDWAFDGADEVDPQRNLIKGRGGAMFKEKLVIDSSPKTFILVDQTKLVTKLGQKFPIPIEVFPLALNLVTSHLQRLGAATLELRPGVKKDGPVITENGNLILDVHFNDIGPTLEREIKSVPGVVESGLFQGRQVEILVPGS